MERPTKEFTTAGGNKYVLKTYLTFDETEPVFKIEDQFEKSRKIIEATLISVNGITGGAYAALRQLPLADYTEVAKAVSMVVGGDFQPVK